MSWGYVFGWYMSGGVLFCHHKADLLSRSPGFECINQLNDIWKITFLDPGGSFLIVHVTRVMIKN